MKHVLYIAMALVLPTTLAAQTLDAFEEAGTEAETHFFEKTRAAREAKEALWLYLDANRPSEAISAEIRGDLSPADKARLAGGAFTKSSSGQTIELIGLEQQVAVPIALRESQSLLRGKSLVLGDSGMTHEGDAVWATSLSSEGANGLRIHFTDFDLPTGAELYIYNDDGQAHGPYSGKGPIGTGDFWSNTVHGDQAWIQLHRPLDDSGKPVEVSFTIAALSHLGPEFQQGRSGFEKADCSANVDCIVNVNCYDDQPLATARRAVARIVFQVPGGTGGCSGGLLNDSDSTDRTPWFLTANHCISTESSANSVEAFFRYDSPCGSCDGDDSSTVLGATLRARGGYPTGDFSLLELSELPSGWGLFGWTSANVRNAPGTEITILSHPQGQPQSVSEHEVITPRANKPAMIFSEIVLGTDEGGSSGAPAFISGGKVVGIHSGATLQTDPMDACDPATFDARQGALSYFWKSVRPYLGSPSATNKMHIASVEVESSRFIGTSGAFYWSYAIVTVADELGNGIPHAIVSGTFSGDQSGSRSARTDENGNALIIGPSFTSTASSFTFCVDDVSHEYFDTYDTASNVVTCASR
ncbi:MAG: trypsin-like peptidase domain-containing protein [Acidobacteriota bacterium]